MVHFLQVTDYWVRLKFDLLFIVSCSFFHYQIFCFSFVDSNLINVVSSSFFNLLTIATSAKAPTYCFRGYIVRWLFISLSLKIYSKTRLYNTVDNGQPCLTPIAPLKLLNVLSSAATCYFLLGVYQSSLLNYFIRSLIFFIAWYSLFLLSHKPP